MPTDVVDPLSTDEPVRPPVLGFFGGLRWAWRQLTSMRTALFLLFLWAVAAVPGSVFPQRGVAPLRVADYFREHPTLAPILDNLSLFDVYAAPWFAAIYLLLMVSLAGCILPRCVHYAKALRAKPPATPRNLARLPVYREAASDESTLSSARRGEETLRSNGFRVERAPSGDSVAAEKGYLHEFGNLVFHVAILVILLGVAWGALFGYRGTVVVIEGEGFSNLLTQYDDFNPGRSFQPDMLAPFSFTLNSFDATFVDVGSAAGSAIEFPSRRDLSRRAQAVPTTEKAIAVNEPLVIDGTKVFLLGSGYAPMFTSAMAKEPWSSTARSQRFRRIQRSRRRPQSRSPMPSRNSSGSSSPLHPPRSGRSIRSRDRVRCFPRATTRACTWGRGQVTWVSIRAYRRTSTSSIPADGADWAEGLGAGTNLGAPGGSGLDHLRRAGRVRQLPGSARPGSVGQFAGSGGGDHRRDGVTVRQAAPDLGTRHAPVAEGRTLVQVAGLARIEAVGLAGEVDQVLTQTIGQGAAVSDTSLANISNLLVYGSLVVLALALLAFAADLAVGLRSPSRAGGRRASISDATAHRRGRWGWCRCDRTSSPDRGGRALGASRCVAELLGVLAVVGCRGNTWHLSRPSTLGQHVRVFVGRCYCCHRSLAAPGQSST